MLSKQQEPDNVQLSISRPSRTVTILFKSQLGLLLRKKLLQESYIVSLLHCWFSHRMQNQLIIVCLLQMGDANASVLQH